MSVLRKALAPDAGAIGQWAVACLKQEVATYPKPGLVSPVDQGSHRDMDAAMMNRSAEALRPFLTQMADAGAAGAGMDRLRAIGIAAEAAMLVATGGVNTHRGAIFGMGLFCAAVGFRQAYGLHDSLGSLVARRWGEAIVGGPVALHSHGRQVARSHGAGGARAEAAAGFPSLYTLAMPALREGRRLRPGDPNAAQVHACMMLIAAVEDTNLLYRGGAAGLAFAQSSARGFLAAGGVGADDWLARAEQVHRDFVARNLSPGGCADLLAMALFVEGVEG